MGRPKKEVKVKRESYNDGAECLMCKKRQEHFSGVCHRCRKLYGVKKQSNSKVTPVDTTVNGYVK